MHLSKLAIPKPDLAQFASARNFSQQLTTRYVVHSVLAEAFSECPTPFEVQDKGRLLRVLFYSAKDADGLASHAKFAASPEAYEAVDWTEAASKPMPESFPAGMELRFSLRACPVVRKASAGKGRNKDGEIREWNEGTELDAFLSRQWTSDTELSRKEVYCDWLEHQFDARGGAVPQNVTMERFTIAEMTRRTGGNNRSVKSMKRPDVTLQGTLKVEDSAPFARLLQSGLGRHKSFGYGMLKIRPV